MNEHPNASVAALAGAATTLILWAVDSFVGQVPTEVAGAVLTLVTAGILFLGRRRGTPA